MIQKFAVRKIFVTFTALLLITAAANARSSVNKSVNVAPGETLSESVSSVNGSVNVGANAVLQGEAETVNGSLSIDDGCQTRDLSSVNGAVRVGERVQVDGNVSTVNGTLRIGDQSTISGNVETVNGSIDLRGATVERDIETVNGGIVLDQGAIVRGSIIVPATRSRGNKKWRGTLDIELRGGSSVVGDIRVEDEDRKVRVILRDGSTVGGQIQGAEIVRE